MFNVGGGELLVIMVIALIVLGPNRLPDAARQVGKVMGDLKKLSTGFQDEMKTAFTEADDPTRVAPRRNVLSREEPTAVEAEAVEPDPGEVSVADDEAVAAAVEAVSERPAAPPKLTPPARAKATSPTAERATAAEDVLAKADPPDTTA